MRALVLGARGAVGAGVVATLRAQGHAVTTAGRRDGDDVHLDLRVDLDAGGDALAAAARENDVVVNATGLEDPRLGAAIGAASLVDISASAAYLRDLAASAPTASIVLGAGIAPGLSTVLVADLATRPDCRPGDELDVAVMLGAGERHGPSAVAWTAGLVGTRLADPPEATDIVNLRERRRLTGPDGRRRLHLRADFPDHTLVGRDEGVAIRTWLTMSMGLSTAGLALVGRLPRLVGLLRAAPPIGDERWSVTASNRRTGATLSANGVGQSSATARIASLTAARVAQRRLTHPGSTADVLTVADVATLFDEKESPSDSVTNHRWAPTEQ